MRLLAVSDLHYRLPHYDWVAAAAAEADVVCISGDLLDVANPVPLEAQAAVVRAVLERVAERAPVVVASGNHDLDGPGPDGEQVAGWLTRLGLADVHVDGATLALDGLRVTAAPWWDGPLGRERVATLFGAEAGQPSSGRRVWVYHAPPAGTRLCSDGRRSFPDHALAGWIDDHRPDLVLCGHIHQSPWVDGGGWYDWRGSTAIVNAGKQIGREPPHTWIDTVTGAATWWGLGVRDDAQLW